MDRFEWPKGQWDDEPDTLKFKYRDFECELLRNKFGAWCGYVLLPIGLLDQSQIESLDVHGDITFNEQINDTQWSIGFDCNHFDDLTPINIKFIDIWAKALPELYNKASLSYKNIEFAKEQCKYLVDQISEMLYGKSN